MSAPLKKAGCEALLRASYEDETKSFVMTVGVAVLPSAAAAADVARTMTESGTVVQPDLAGHYYSRQLSSVLTAGPYLIMYQAGYADGRPRVQLTHDSYAQTEITSMASGVAQEVANDLAAAPPPAQCPGGPGC